MPIRTIGLASARVIGALRAPWLAAFWIFILIGISIFAFGPSWAASEPAKPHPGAVAKPAKLSQIAADGDLITASHGVWRLALLDRPRQPELVPWSETLSDLLPTGTPLTLTDAYQDRWGRQVGLVATPLSASLQVEMVERGLAVVNPLLWSGSLDTKATTTPIPLLLAAENRARQNQRGLWAPGGRQVEPADGAISTDDGQMHIVQGTILSVSEVRDVWYLNFGSNWRRDFTVRLDKAQAKAWDKSQRPALPSLKGRLVRVRGWPRWANGPLIELTSPYMLEVIVD